MEKDTEKCTRNYFQITVQFWEITKNITSVFKKNLEMRYFERIIKNPQKKFNSYFVFEHSLFYGNYYKKEAWN